MIYTVTLNPSLDYQINTRALRLGTLNRVSDTAYYPGGKGINVSRVLNNLNVPSIILGFIGGFTGEYMIHSLEKEGIETDFTKHEALTRINVKVRSSEEETEINDAGPIISAELQQNLLHKMESLLKKDDILILSGSLPSSLSAQFYNHIAHIVREKDAFFVIDIPDEHLMTLLTFNPLLIKPNQLELSHVLDIPIHNKQDAVKGAEQLLTMGAENVIVSMGEAGAIFVNEHHVLDANTPKGTLKSSVGAGDSVVAGFIAAYSNGQDVKQAFKYSIASGTATAFSTDLCRKKDVDILCSKVEVNEWKGE